jgi:hypothetical protein
MNKFLNPKEVEAKFKNVADSVGMGIDKNIFRSVVILNSLGYETRQSCEGHINRYSTKPWIEVQWVKENSEEYLQKSLKFFHENLFQDLKEFYQNRKNIPYDQQIILEIMGSGQLRVRLSQYENSKCFKGRRAEKIAAYLKEINDFCEFLNQKYQLNY